MINWDSQKPTYRLRGHHQQKVKDAKCFFLPLYQ